jgi:anti-anti-sigma factor
MELKVSREENCVLAKTIGAVDHSARQLFRESLHLLVAQRGTNVVLDLSHSNYITSDGIEQLVSLACHANSSGSRVILAACSPFISEVLNRCKLNRFFEIADTRYRQCSGLDPAAQATVELADTGVGFTPCG